MATKVSRLYEPCVTNHPVGSTTNGYEVLQTHAAVDVQLTRGTTEGALLSSEVPQFGELISDLSQKLIWRGKSKKTAARTNSPSA